MTLIAGCCALLAGWLSLAFVAQLGEAVVSRTRAQAAADAAALAAIAESMPGERGAHEDMARRYAAANGAALVRCNCAAGATSVEVEAEVGGIAARARAVLDTRLLRPASGAAHGLHPDLERAVGEILRESAGAVTVVSGRRSAAAQARLWEEALHRYGNASAARRWVAPPGASMHEKGLAVDLGGDLDLAARLVRRLGLPLVRPLPHEPWHFELVL